MEEKEGWGEEKEEERGKGERKKERKKERRKGGKKTVREKEGWKKKVGKKEEKGDEERKEGRKEGLNAERMVAASKECTKCELLSERSERYKANHTFQEIFRLPIWRMEVYHNSIN